MILSLHVEDANETKRNSWRSFTHSELVSQTEAAQSLFIIVFQACVLILFRSFYDVTVFILLFLSLQVSLKVTLTIKYYTVFILA